MDTGHAGDRCIAAIASGLHPRRRGAKLRFAIAIGHTRSRRKKHEIVGPAQAQSGRRHLAATSTGEIGAADGRIAGAATVADGADTFVGAA
jgi:hypothetical protein